MFSKTKHDSRSLTYIRDFKCQGVRRKKSGKNVKKLDFEEFSTGFGHQIVGKLGGGQVTLDIADENIAGTDAGIVLRQIHHNQVLVFGLRDGDEVHIGTAFADRVLKTDRF